MSVLKWAAIGLGVVVGAIVLFPGEVYGFFEQLNKPKPPPPPSTVR